MNAGFNDSPDETISLSTYYFILFACSMQCVMQYEFKRRRQKRRGKTGA